MTRVSLLKDKIYRSGIEGPVEQVGEETLNIYKSSSGSLKHKSREKNEENGQRTLNCVSCNAKGCQL